MTPGDGTIRLTGENGTVLYEGPGRVVMDPPETDGMAVLPGVQELEDGDPRSWGISFGDVRPDRAPGEPTMAQVERWEHLLRTGPESGEQRVAAEMARAGIHAVTVDATVLRVSARHALLRAYGLPEEVIGPQGSALGVQPHMAVGNHVEGSAPEAYEERERLMAETRAEFPPDRYDYGRFNPEGPMRWTPPDDGEEVPSCPA
jgi:hypothetical protein